MRIVFLLGMLLSSSTFGQSQTYSSEVDNSVTIRKVMIVPMVDNVNAIYAKPLTDFLVDLVKEDRQWVIVGAGGTAQGPEQLSEDTAQTAALLKKNKADALFAGRISKGPKGLTIQLALIGGTQALPLAQDSLIDYSGFETEDLRIQTRKLFENIKRLMPYQGTVLSRQGQVVTVNLGQRHGLRPGDEVPAVLVTSLQRHPKFKFITKAQREIMGRIQINKVDDSISFGSIIEERSTNLIQPGFKVTVDQGKAYPRLAMTADGKLVPKINDRADQDVAFGDAARESNTDPQATFGKIGLLAGITSTSLSSSWADGTSASSLNPISPTIAVEGEMWFDPRWQMNLDLTQMGAKISNGLSGSTPDPLNLQFQQLALSFGYNFLAQEEFFGPKFQLQFGYSTTALNVDDSSPRAHTSKTYGGMLLSLGGSFPMQTEAGRRFSLGGKFVYHLSPSTGESPASSGSASSRMNQFSFFGEINLTPKLYAKGSLNFRQMASNFSGGAGNTASANLTSFLAGVGYLF